VIYQALGRSLLDTSVFAGIIDTGMVIVQSLRSCLLVFLPLLDGNPCGVLPHPVSVLRLRIQKRFEFARNSFNMG
jgi:hypothetical protein